MYHFTSSVDPSEGPGDGKLLGLREGTARAVSGFRLSVPRLIDPLGDTGFAIWGFPILDSKCWSYAFDES